MSRCWLAIDLVGYREQINDGPWSDWKIERTVTRWVVDRRSFWRWQKRAGFVR